MDLDGAVGRAIELAGEARANGDHPFSALLLVDGLLADGLLVDGEVVATALNRVNTDHDITAHAEMMLVRGLERDGQLDLLATGIVVASTEPCPMCVGAMFWAGARHVVFGLSAARLNAMVRRPGADEYGFEMTAIELGGRASPPMLVEGPRREDAAASVHDGFWT